MLFKNKDELIENGRTESLRKKRSDILKILSSAVESVDPYTVLATRFINEEIVLDSCTLNPFSFTHVFLVGFGKASVEMAQSVCDRIPIKRGVVITNDVSKKVHHPLVQTIAGGHPLPDENSIRGTEMIEKIIADCTPNDLLIVLISGGGSSLLCHPRVPLKDMQQTTQLLLRSGATISEINTIRKHLSHVKGGNLIKDVTCTVVSFIISDVVNDPLEFIASGPTCGDDTTFDDTISILKQYTLWQAIPSTVRTVLIQGQQGVIPETPSKDDKRVSKSHNVIVANNVIACENAFNKARELGYRPFLLSTSLVGEAKDIGRDLEQRARELFQHQDIDLCIAGGETTVSVLGNGRGGRNQEMVLSVVEQIQGTDHTFVSFATDGVDGMSPAAGAIADRYSLLRSAELQMDHTKYLSENDSYTFFKALHDVLDTGPTGTNVMDIQLIIK